MLESTSDVRTEPARANVTVGSIQSAQIQMVLKTGKITLEYVIAQSGEREKFSAGIGHGAQEMDVHLPCMRLYIIPGRFDMNGIVPCVLNGSPEYAVKTIYHRSLPAPGVVIFFDIAGEKEHTPGPSETYS